RPLNHYDSTIPLRRTPSVSFKQELTFSSECLNGRSVAVLAEADCPLRGALIRQSNGLDGRITARQFVGFWADSGRSR
ncbi:hypothetical protein, partial [Sphingobium amiense]|uniref:hypothetical protein n=1 Tax=Sphingobium amiense TaxID=135719 RepID=UPI001C3F1E54